MFRFNTAKILLFAGMLSLMCLSVSDLSARPIADTETIVNEKPPSFAQWRRTEGPTELIGPAAPPEPPSVPQQSIIISLTDQRMWVFEGDMIVQRFPVSTGVSGHRTPPGHYSVRSRAPRAYSRKYDAWMLNWMAITPDGSFGMHALQGTSYLRHLGSVASHGCIRLSHENARWLYDWVRIGTPVDIVVDWDEPPPTKNLSYRVCKRYCL